MDPSHPSNHPPSHPLPPRAKSQTRYRLAFIVAAVVGILALVGTIRRFAVGQAHVESLGYTDLLSRGATGEITKAEIDGERVLVKLKNGGSASSIVSNAHSQHALVAMLSERGVAVEFLAHDASGERAIGTLAPVIVLLSLVGGGYLIARKRRLSHVRQVHHVGQAPSTSFA